MMLCVVRRRSGMPGPNQLLCICTLTTCYALYANLKANMFADGQSFSFPIQLAKTTRYI